MAKIFDSNLVDLSLFYFPPRYSLKIFKNSNKDMFFINILSEKEYISYFWKLFLKDFNEKPKP
jgi:hypothetical protein